MAAISGFERWFIKLQFGGKDRLSLYRKLVRFLGNGVSLTTALETMFQHASLDGKKPKSVQAVVITSWLAHVNNGKPFGYAIQEWVPHNDRIVIEAGETSGKLSEAIDNACLLFESQKKIKSAVILGIAYPALLLCVAVGFMWMFGTQVIPSFEQITDRSQWTGIAAQMAMMADFVHSGLVPTIIAAIALVILIVWSLPRWTGKLRARVDAYAPYSIYRLVAGSGFLLSLAALVKAGVTVPNVLRILQRDSTPWYGERMGKTLAHVNNGVNIGDALYRTGLNFPDRETVNDLRSYAVLEGFDEMLMKLGRENLEDTVARIQSQASIMRNVGIVVLGGVFAWIAVGIFALQSQITSGM